METIADFQPKYAGFWIRFWAYLFDLLIIASVGWLIVKPLFRLFNIDLQATIWYAPITILSAIIFYGYFTLMTYFFRQTLGKMIFGIRVHSLAGEKPDFFTVLFRETIGRILSVIPFNLPYIIVGFTPKKQAIHDFIADTVVVHEADYHRTFRPNQLHQPNVVQ
ncbi:RDD family protein [Chryseomicrobium sp. FSL W7-1435]|uniref:RDD family protein n=1 Tax=Chryseomicrobium sp. FSL W7-1435 TaxID=2921704 RepID=UPI00315ABCAE